LKFFEFSNDVVPRVLKELNQAEKFIKIAIFQVHLDDLFNLLERKVDYLEEIDIFTLPYESINESTRENVTTRLKKLIDSGVKLHFCKWNVGDPERTTTAIGRWYSFHGKFIVTDKSAIILSANFIKNNELDSCIVIKNDQNIIDNFRKKFDELLNIFVVDHKGYEGNIRQKILDTKLENVEKVFELPKVIESSTHKDNWIMHYPASICPDNFGFEEKLYLVPFDIRGRKAYENILTEAEKFIYISAESFTDLSFGLFLRQLKQTRQIEIILLTGFTSMDFTDRIQKMFRELIADDIKLGH